MDEQKLHNYLLKCELQYRADHTEGADELAWLAPHCGSVQEIAKFLRELGFKIQEIVDEQSCGDCFQWVITTSGVIVYANNQHIQGLFSKTRKTVV